MEHRTIEGSLLAPSEIGLGTNNFGTRLGETESRAVVDAAIEAGINFFDTADIYGGGASEGFLGRALGARRKDVIVATKFGHPTDLAGFSHGASPQWIREAVDESLRRLNTDWIDLYQIHMPDRETPIVETLSALDDLVSSGKVRCIGTSNFAAWELVDADWTARAGDLARPVFAEYVWNLVEREIEGNVLSAARHLGLGLIVARPLAYGFLTGKFGGAGDVTGARLPGSKRARDLLTEANNELLGNLATFAADRGHTVLELALGYLLTEPCVSSVIASASTPEQLQQNIRSATWRIAPEDRLALDGLLPSVATGQPSS